MEEKKFIIMGLNNQIANLQSRFEMATIKALDSEELVTQIKNNAVSKNLKETIYAFTAGVIVNRNNFSAEALVYCNFLQMFRS